MNWYKIAKYEDEWYGKIEELAQSNPYPFKHLFPNGNRIYLPFQINAEEGVDGDVKRLLEGEGYKITDYRGGYCTQDGSNNNKIGKILQKILKKEISDIHQKNEQGQVYNLERDINSIQTYMEGVMNTFQNSSYRKSKSENEFLVAISQDPHDIAKMSTDRSWDSCMTLGSGAYHKDVFCEVQVGSLIAYLINANDEDIQKPLARIRLRRFENNNGQSIIMPEESVYGNHIEGFEQIVKNWVKSVQGDISSGLYTRQGGEYSDTFDKSKFVAPTSKEGILKFLHGEVNTEQYVTYTIEDELQDEYSDDITVHPEFKTKEEAQSYINSIDYDDSWRDYYGEHWVEQDEETGEYSYQRYSLQKHEPFTKESLIDEAIQIILNAPVGDYEEKIIKEVKNIIYNNDNYSGNGYNDKRRFSTKYPKMISFEEAESEGSSHGYEYIDRMEEGPEKDIHKQRILDGIREDLKNPETLVDPAVAERNGSMYDLQNNIHNFITEPLILLFQPIPADISNLLANLISKLLKNETIGFHGEEEMNPEDKISAANNIMHIFSMTKTDTPEIQQLYADALPAWGSSMKIYAKYGGAPDSPINISTLGYSIARLGENGRQFIPFIKKKLKEEETLLEKIKSEATNYELRNVTPYLEKSIEKHLFVIDALESGTGFSNKYKWAKNTNWYKTAKQKEASIKSSRSQTSLPIFSRHYLRRHTSYLSLPMSLRIPYQTLTALG